MSSKRASSRKTKSVTAVLKRVFRSVTSKILPAWKYLPGYTSGIILAVILALLGYFVVFKTNLFLISEVHVQGTKHTSADELNAVVSENIGTNIFNFSPEEESQRLLNEFPYIKEVKVDKNLPNKITVEVVERVPFLAAIDSEGTLYYLDTQGVLLEEPEKTSVDYSSITKFEVKSGFTKAYIEKGSNIDLPTQVKISAEFSKLKFAYQIHELYKSEDHEHRINHYRATRSHLEVVLESDARVIFDYSEDVNLQFDRYIRIIRDAELKNQKLEYLDVSLEEPYGKYR